MKTKYKLTSFAKFFLFMIIFLPGSYLGLSLYKGEITASEIADKFIYRFTISTDSDVKEQTASNCSDIIQLKEKEIELLKERINILENAQ